MLSDSVVAAGMVGCEGSWRAIKVLGEASAAL